jgi:uracil-DNA glycosylase family 4
MNIRELKADLSTCKACSFACAEFPPLSPTASHAPVRVMFIGENPSWAKDQNAPFAKTTISGSSLREHYLKPLGLAEDEVWITDLFKCRYPKNIYRDKVANGALIQSVASTCAELWLVREIEIAGPRVIVTLGDKEVYQRLRSCFDWNSPRAFKNAVGQLHEVHIGSQKARVMPMIHPDIARPFGDGDARKRKAREKWAPLHQTAHLPLLRAAIRCAT